MANTQHVEPDRPVSEIADTHLPAGTEVIEAEVTRVRNGISVNYTDPYVCRRSPDCLVDGGGMASEGVGSHRPFATGFDNPTIAS